MRQLQRNYLTLITGLFFLGGCGDGSNPTSTAGSGGAGGSGGSGNQVLEIERPANAIEGEYIFFFKADAVTPDMVQGIADELVAKNGGTIMDVYKGSIVGFSAKNLDDTKALAIASDNRVEALGQNGVAELSAVQTPPSWGLDRIDQQGNALNNKYEYFLTGKDVHAYVIDSGIRSTHQDFAGRIGPGFSFVFDGKGTEDCNGHGTHVAGILGGTTYGVAKGVTLHPVRIADCGGYLSIGGMIAGIDWVTQNHIKPAVINLSGGTNAFTMLDVAAANAVKAGVVFVAAAGNPAPYGTFASKYSPGRTPEVINVGAIGKDEYSVLYTNYGDAIDIFAPGADIVSAGIAGDTDSATKSGTSMAAPHVAGMVAQYLEQLPNATPSQVASGIYGGATQGHVKGDKGAANRLLFTRFVVDPASGFVEVFGATDFSNANGWDSTSRRWQSLRLADIDGNGLDDICGYAPQGIICTVNTGTSFKPNTTWLPDIKDGTAWEQDRYWHNIHYVDVNGDKKADLCARNGEGIACALSNGTAFGALQQWTTDFADATGWAADPKYFETIAFPDVNGDGKADVCGRAGNGVVCAVSAGTAFGPLSFLATAFADVGDFNIGQAYWGTIRFPDVNGDGKADVCGRSTVGIVCAISTGTTFAPSTQWDTDFGDGKNWAADASRWTTIQYADVNGDKKADVCGRFSDGIHCAISDGTKFNNYMNWSPNFDDAAQWNNAQERYGTIRFADINGDGKADVCGRGGEGVVCEISSGTAFKFYQLWSSTFNDAAGYNNITYTQTLQFGKVINDAKVDFCMRSSTTFGCFVSK